MEFLLTLVYLVIAYGAPLLVAFFGTQLALYAARRRNFYDVPNERSSHEEPTPRSGGIAIVTGVVLGPLLFARIAGLPDFVLGTLLACAVGLADDVRTLRPWIKMSLLLAVALLVARVERVDVVQGMPFSSGVDLGWEALPLTVFWLACYPNAFNFMDGLNGIAAMTAIVSATIFAVAASGAPYDPTLQYVASATALASLGFLPWNFPKARIFMGDAGSLPLGLLLAWMAVRANATGVMPFPASVLLLGPFLFDVTFTLVRRVAAGERLGEAHKNHLYQRLSRVWGSHAKVSLLYAGFSVATGSLALRYAEMSETGKLLSLVVPLAAMLVFAAIVLRAERKKGP